MSFLFSAWRYASRKRLGTVALVHLLPICKAYELSLRFTSGFLYESVLLSFYVLTVRACNFWQNVIGAKAARKMLVTKVNFESILQAAFVPISFCKKFTSPNCKHMKAA